MTDQCPPHSFRIKTEIELGVTVRKEEPHTNTFKECDVCTASDIDAGTTHTSLL